MAILTTQMQADECLACEDNEPTGISYEGEATVRIANDAAENGYDQDPGPLTWLNSARITTDPADDAVHCLVSVGDPRGAFCMTVRRCPDGRIVLHLPYPAEGMAHLPTQQLHEGTLVIVGHGDNAKPVDFSDPEPEEEEDED